jgi:hypothetical protein
MSLMHQCAHFSIEIIPSARTIRLVLEAIPKGQAYDRWSQESSAAEPQQLPGRAHPMDRRRLTAARRVPETRDESSALRTRKCARPSSWYRFGDNGRGPVVDLKAGLSTDVATEDHRAAQGVLSVVDGSLITSRYSAIAMPRRGHLSSRAPLANGCPLPRYRGDIDAPV